MSLKPLAVPIRGIDISYANVSVDLTKAKASGIGFAIVRTGYRRKTDDMFRRHMQNARKAGMDVGAYCYCLSRDPEEARRDADHALELIEQYKPKYPLFYDVEDRSLENLSREELTQIALAFVERVSASGVRAGVYANPSWFLNRLYADRFKKYDIWLAHWTEDPDVPTKYNFGQKIWQWGVSTVPGIKGMVDSDLCYVDYDQLPSGSLEPYYADDFLNFRKEPRITALVLGVIPPGGEVLVYPDKSYSADGYTWRKAVFNGLEGYVAARYLVKK